MPTLRALRAAPLALAYLLGAGGRRRANGRARVLMLHGIPQRQARGFERAMRYVRRHFDVVPLAQLARAASDGNARFDRQLAITFDDGLRNNVQVAYPILRALRLPATFFICPGLVDEGRWLWNHEARQRLKRLGAAARQEIGGSPDVEAIVERMKAIPLEQRIVLERRIKDATPSFRPTGEERHEFDLAGWDELRSLDPAIVSFGSHTLTHPILTQLDAGRVREEVVESRWVLEARLGRPIETFAYPNGNVSPEVADCVRGAYRAAVTVEEGQVEPGSDPHLLPRINVPASALRLALALHRDHFLVTPITTSGSQVAMEGKAITTTSASTIMQKKGIEASAT